MIIPGGGAKVEAKTPTRGRGRRLPRFAPASPPPPPSPPSPLRPLCPRWSGRVRPSGSAERVLTSRFSHDSVRQPFDVIVVGAGHTPVAAAPARARPGRCGRAPRGAVRRVRSRERRLCPPAPSGPMPSSFDRARLELLSSIRTLSPIDGLVVPLARVRSHPDPRTAPYVLLGATSLLTTH
jgi:hypothetical protein